MNNPINNGGPAFPCETYGLRNGKETTIPTNGMTLRDWFAGQASEADIEAHEGGQVNQQSGLRFNTRSREQAKYVYADAMLAAREVKP